MPDTSKLPLTTLEAVSVKVQVTVSPGVCPERAPEGTSVTMVPVGLCSCNTISRLKLKPLPRHAPVALSIGLSHLVRLMVVVTPDTKLVKPENVNPVLLLPPSTISTGLKVADWVAADAA